MVQVIESNQLQQFRIMKWLSYDNDLLWKYFSIPSALTWEAYMNNNI